MVGKELMLFCSNHYLPSAFEANIQLCNPSPPLSSMLGLSSVEDWSGSDNLGIGNCWFCQDQHFCFSLIPFSGRLRELG
jgi:hypothetical protein